MRLQSKSGTTRARPLLLFGESQSDLRPVSGCTEGYSISELCCCLFSVLTFLRDNPLPVLSAHTQPVLDISVGVCPLGGQGTLRPVNKASLPPKNKCTFILHSGLTHTKRVDGRRADGAGSDWLKGSSTGSFYGHILDIL